MSDIREIKRMKCFKEDHQEGSADQQVKALTAQFDELRSILDSRG